MYENRILCINFNGRIDSLFFDNKKIIQNNPNEHNHSQFHYRLYYRSQKPTEI